MRFIQETKPEKLGEKLDMKTRTSFARVKQEEKKNNKKMENTKNFADGLRFSLPSEKAPEWVKGQISVNVAKFLPWAEANQDERGWLNIDIKLSKNNSLYCELNTWKKDKTGQKRTPKTDEFGSYVEKVKAARVEEPEEELNLPF